MNSAKNQGAAYLSAPTPKTSHFGIVYELLCVLKYTNAGLYLFILKYLYSRYLTPLRTFFVII